MGCSIYFRHTYFKINLLRHYCLSPPIPEGPPGHGPDSWLLRSWNKTPVSSILKFVLNQVLLSIPYIRVQVYREVLHCFSSNSTTGGPNLFWMSCEDNSSLQCLPLTTTGQVGHPTAKATTWYRSSSSRGGQSKCIWVCTQCPQKTLSGLIS